MITFIVTLSVEDLSESEGEDVQMVIEDILQEHLPSDLVVRDIDIEVTSEST